jgi:hypothetical protein
MVSIPHYEELSARAIYDSLDLMWWPSEKLDGSFLGFGLDDAGRYYSYRKGGQFCYCVEDWPNECWASSYRIAHNVGAMVVEALVKENLLKPGQKLGAEIIHGNIPNTIRYLLSSSISGLLIITSADFEFNEGHIRLLDDFKCKLEVEYYGSPDGLSRELFKEKQRWLTFINPQMSRQLVQARLSTHAKQLRTVLDHWFQQDTRIEGFNVFDILDINLSKKHHKCGDRNWNDLKKELSKERDDLKQVFRSMILMFKDIAYRVLVLEQPSAIGAGSFVEGVVVESNQGKFKIVDRESFQAANRFTHFIKYWLVGGRRPARPSFLSRTKDWPKEERLKRLDTLLKRYLDNRHILHHVYRFGARQELLVYSGQLHQRTLNMFSDTRKRIEDGR